MPGLGGGSWLQLGSQSSQDGCGKAHKVTWAKIWHGQQGRIIRGNPLTASGREMRWRAPGRPSGCPSTSPPARTLDNWQFESSALLTLGHRGRLSFSIMCY